MTPRINCILQNLSTPLAAVAEMLTRLKLTQMPVVQEEKPVYISFGQNLKLHVR